MKKNLTEMVWILDRSGSMGGLESDTIGGYNAMLKKQRKEEGEALVTTYLFNNTSTMIHDRVPLDQVPDLTEKEYFVGGCTALLDTVGEAVHHISQIHRYARQEDVPEHTIVVITTDGLENASHRYTLEKVRQMIKHEQEKYGWEFLFLGANMDAVETAGSMGIRADRAATYECDSVGTQLNYEAASFAVSSMRSKRPLKAEWKRAVEDYRKGK